MGFYIRKAFRLGPVRLNLSKSGLGVSAGVRGARLGITSQGRAYGHAGRGGLYVREYFTNSGGTQKRSIGRVGEPIIYEQESEYTYGQGREQTPATNSGTQLAGVKRGLGLAGVVGVVLGLVGILTLLIGLAMLASQGLASIPTLLLGAGILGGSIFLYARDSKRLRAELSLRSLMFESAEGISVGELEAGKLVEALGECSLKKDKKDAFTKAAYLKAIEALAARTRPSASSIALLHRFADILSVDDTFRLQADRDLFDQIYFEAICDHELSHEEEEDLEMLRSKLQIPDSEIQGELAFIEELKSIRGIQSGNLTETQTEQKLQRGEVCYFEGVGRILKSKQIETFRREGQQYKIRQLVLKKEGTLLVTSKRLVLLNSGTSNVRLDVISDFELDYDRKLLCIQKEGVQTPTYVTTPKALVVGALLEALTSRTS